ncbi:hypothetical protein CF166_11325 [Amycolatopsis sp. KNN50.9b]|nr:hypothetical protein CF166_11325 [Amycolatopsis sp. KNN50.9b]
MAPYRERVARLLDSDGHPAGYLMLVADVWYEALGPWWRRRWSAGQERLNWWAEVLTDGEWTWSDGGWLDIEEAVAELSSGTFDFYGRELTIAWLDGEEAAEVRNRIFGR